MAWMRCVALPPHTLHFHVVEPNLRGTYLLINVAPNSVVLSLRLSLRTPWLSVNGCLSSCDDWLWTLRTGKEK